MNKLFLNLYVVVLLAAPGLPLEAGSLERGAPAQLEFSAERLERLSTVLEHYVDDGQLAGSETGFR